MFHGYPYSGAYDGGAVDGVEWPGFSGFESSRWSNNWGERQPNWLFANTYLDFVARNQYVLSEDELVPADEAAAPMEGSVEVTDWSLSVESWTPGATVLDTKKTAIDLGVIDELKPWIRPAAMRT